LLLLSLLLLVLYYLRVSRYHWCIVALLSALCRQPLAFLLWPQR